MQLRKNHATGLSTALLKPLLNKIIYKFFSRVVIYQKRNLCKIMISKNLLVHDHMEEQGGDGKITLRG
jgi:hypothetical protein